MPFSNPVVGGTSLVRPAIKSPNYVPGVSGWSINRDGTAEFSGTIIRGNLIVVGSNGSIETSLQSGYPTLFFYNADKSNYGFINIVSNNPGDANLGINSGRFQDAIAPGDWLRSRLFFAPYPFLGTVDETTGVSQVGSGMSLAPGIASYFIKDEAGTNLARVNLQDNGWAIVQGGNGATLNGPLTVWAADDIIMKNTVASDGVAYRKATTYLEHTLNGSWTNLTLNSGWTAKAGYTVPQYRRNALGNVEFRGTMTGGTNVDNTQIATIPAALVPVNDTLMKPILAPTGAGSAGSSRLYNNGSIAIFCYGCAGAGDIGLDGIFYSLAP